MACRELHGSSYQFQELYTFLYKAFRYPPFTGLSLLMMTAKYKWIPKQKLWLLFEKYGSYFSHHTIDRNIYKVERFQPKAEEHLLPFRFQVARQSTHCLGGDRHTSSVLWLRPRCNRSFQVRPKDNYTQLLVSEC